MANDSEINIGTKIDESGVDKGLKSVKNKVNNAAKDMNKGTKVAGALKTAFNETGGAAASLSNKLGSIATNGGAVAAGIGTAILAAKKMIQGIRDTSDAYRDQNDAETALQVAAMNNPYLNDEGVRRLKDYAKALQKVTEISDNEAMDVMAQLASTGRTEAEILKIVGAAADYAAATHTDLASAAQTLNATYSGMSGTLGRQVGAIKELTEEELKNGNAVDIIAKKYNGFAESLANSDKKAANAKKSFTEALGKITDPTATAWDDFWTGFYNKGVQALEWLNEKLEHISAKMALDKNVEIATTVYTNSTGEEVRGEKFFTDDQLKSTVKVLEEILDKDGKISDEREHALFILRNEIEYRARLMAEEERLAIKAEEKRKAEEAAAKARKGVKTADDYATENNKKLQESLAALEIEARAKGESVSAQDKYNLYLQSYIELLTKTEGAIKEGYPVEQKRLEQLQEAKKAVDGAADAEQKLAAAIQLTQAATDALNSANRNLTPAEELEAEIKQLDEIRAKIEAMSEAEIAATQKGQEKQLTKSELTAAMSEAEKQATLEKVDAITASEESWWDKYANKQQELLNLKKEIDESEVLSEEEKIAAMSELDEAYSKSKKEQYAELATEIKGYTDQAVNIMQDTANLMLDTVKNQATAEQAELETKYRKGEISEEEYNEKISESKKKAAREQYKIQMFQWSASILQAMANTAQGVTQAIAQGGVAGLITGTLVAAAGGVQLASIIASKPSPPSFSTGGIMGGTSYHGDNMAANLNSREMVMNMSQQKSLWDFINGGSNGQGAGANIVINNSASNIATAQPRLTRDKIEIMIDARVNDSLKNGRYNNSMNMAQQGMTGDYYGI